MPSENGWEPARASADQCEWITVPGTNPPVSLQLLKGQPLAILRAWAADFNAFIEPLRDADSAGWTPTNSVPTSNHLNGTAVDLNWNSHPFQILNAGFDDAKITTIREMLDYYENTVWWGNDWDSPKDAMHFNLDYDTYNNPHTGDFINRKIRADGFSTYRRGGTVTPPPPPALSRADRYALATIQEGQRLNITPKGICIALAVELVETNLTMYANSNVPASLSLPHDAVGSDHDSTGTFQQRQAWGPLSSTMDPALSAGLFFLGGQAGQRGLTDFDYNSDSRTPGGWAQAVQVSAFPDRYDARFNDAVAIYDRLATAPPTQEDDMAQVPQDQWDRVYRELTQRLPSRSPLRHLDQTAFYPDGLVDTMAGMVLNTDGSEHVQYVSLLASYGHPPTLALLQEVASAAGDSRYPDRQDDAKLAQAILAGVTSQPSAPPVAAVAVAPTDNSAALATAYAENARLRDENARLQAAVNTPPTPTSLPAVVEPTVPAMTSGDHAGKVIDSVEDWTQHILAMDTPQRAAFVTSMKALELPNGTQP